MPVSVRSYQERSDLPGKNPAPKDLSFLIVLRVIGIFANSIRCITGRYRMERSLSSGERGTTDEHGEEKRVTTMKTMTQMKMDGGKTGKGGKDNRR
jgi:hypothetical protein